MPEGVSEHKRIGDEFRSTVEAVIAPALLKQSHGIRDYYFDPTAEVQRDIEYQGDTITFTRHLGKTAVSRIGLFDFAPTHTIEIVSQNSSSGSTESQTMFGVKKTGRIERIHLVHTALLFATVARELEDDEAQAAVDYARAPHLNSDKRALALRLLPGEKRHIKEETRRDRKTSEVQHRGLREIARARQSALQDAHKIVLY